MTPCTVSSEPTFQSPACSALQLFQDNRRRFNTELRRLFGALGHARDQG
jgi:hypothetical protein